MIPNFFLNPSVRKRIFFGLFAFLIIFNLLIGFGYLRLDQILAQQDEVDRLREQQRQTMKVRTQAIELQRLLMLYKETASPTAQEKFVETHHKTVQLLNTLASSISDPDQLDAISAMIEHEAQYAENFNTVVEDRTQRRSLIDSQLITRHDVIIDALSKLRNDTSSVQHLLTLDQITNDVLLANIKTQQFLRRQDFKLLTEIHELLESTTGQLELLSQAEPSMTQTANDLGDLLLEYAKTVRIIGQTTRGYVYLINVVMAGKANEILTLSAQLDNQTQLQLNRMAMAANALLKEAYQMTGLMLFIILATSLVLAVWLDKTFIVPIKKLTSVFRKLADGEVIGTIPGSERLDEFGEMATAAEIFRSKNQKVIQLVAELRDLNRELEKHVATRTLALTESNTLLDTIFESIPHMLFLKDATNLSYLRMNKAAEKLIGRSREEIIGKTDVDFYPPEQAAFRASRDREVLAKGVILDIPEEVNESNHRLRYLHTMKVPIKVEDSGSAFLLGISEDITERKQIETEFGLAKEQAESANIAKSRFLANMSHELRTPLNAILGYTEMLLEDEALTQNQQATSDLQKIQTSGNHLLALINDILDLSKIEAGKVEVHMEPMNVSALIQDAISTITLMAKANGNRVNADLKLDKVEICSDSVLLRQILINLLNNAAKFTLDGEINIRAYYTTEQTEGNDASSGDTLVIEIQDTGIGISEDQQKKLFKPFSQADASTTRRYGGTGLGLAISLANIHLLGGTLKLTSEVGIGSTFTLSLPESDRSAEPDRHANTIAQPI